MQTDRKTMYQGLSHAAWGYFLLHFDFNLGTVSILPAFAGYLLLLSAVRDLSGERRDLAPLRPLCSLMAACDGVDWLLSWLGSSLSGRFPPLDLTVAAAALYFHFQFLTDMAALAETHQPEGSNLNRKLLRRRTAYIVLCTVAQLIMCMPAWVYERIYGNVWDIAVGVLAMIALVVALFVMMGLFDLRRCFREEAEVPRP